jgi:hypothetical protein
MHVHSRFLMSRRWLRPILLTALSLLVPFLPASASGAGAATEACVSAAASHWLPQEAWVWERLCNNEKGDLDRRTGLDRPIDALSAPDEVWSGDRLLRAAFLRDILLYEPWRSFIEGIPVDISGAWITDELRIEGATLGQQVEFHSSRIDAPVYVSNGRTDFRFAIFNSRVDARLVFRFMRCQEVLLINSRFGASVDLYGLVSDQSVVLEGSEFLGPVNLAASQADSLNIGRAGAEPTWGPGARLSLRLTRFRNVEDSPEAWRGLNGRLDILGLDYEYFTGWASTWRDLATELGGGAPERPVSWLIGWLEMQEGRDRIYMPQPYEQLADVLQGAGQGHKADAVLYAKHEYWRNHPTTGFSDYLWLTVKKYLIGYGYQVWLTVLWLVGLVVIGAVVLRRSRQGRSVSLADCLLYSIDQALPLVYMNPANERIAEQHSLALKYYFQFHQLASLGLLAFLGAGLAGAIG